MSLGPLMIGIAGPQLTPEEREMLRHPLVGGVILFTRNYEHPEQLEALVADIHNARTPHLIVAVDHEGGRVQRFREGFTRLPPVRPLGECYDRDPKHALVLAELTGWLMAAELRAVGIDISFAPVLDLDRKTSEIIGDRAFHSQPRAIAELAQAYVRGMHKAGMAATAKHFPGHGSIAADTHLTKAIDPRPYADIKAEDMLPFERLIHHGLEAMMIAHVIYPQADPQPAGYSPFWLQEVLRKRLGFQGVIFSDDLGMKAAVEVGGMNERVMLSLRAGCDMVLLCNELECIPPVLETLKVASNPVSQVRLMRLHGRPGLKRSELRLDATWHQALKAIQEYGQPQNMKLV